MLKLKHEKIVLNLLSYVVIFSTLNRYQFKLTSFEKKKRQRDEDKGKENKEINKGKKNKRQ